MKAIRRHLQLRLLAGLGVIWLLSGTSLFLTVRNNLTGKLDAELDLLTAEVGLLLGTPTDAPRSVPGFSRTLDLFVADGGAYFQSWDAYGLFSDRSPSLGNMDLPQPETFSRKVQRWNGTLSSGERIRARATRIAIPVGAPDAGTSVDADVVVARNRDALAHALSLVVLGVSVVGAVAALLCILLVSLTVTSGLADLELFGERCRGASMDSLDPFGDTADLPQELHPIAASLDDMMARLHASFERERRFSADVAHELRTPVAELKTIAECSLRWPEGGKADLSADVLAIADQMAGLLHDLLTISRLEGGRSAPVVVDVDAAELVRECWESAGVVAAERALQADLDLPEHLHVQMDPGLLQIIVRNLLSNAVTYTPEGGHLALTLSAAGDGRLHMRVGNSVTGLTQDGLDHLFERFWRAESARSGTDHHGLGLSLAKLCAETLSYDLSATLDNRGNTLTFDLIPAG